MLLEDLIDGKDRLTPEHDLHGQLEPLFRAYHGAPSNLSIRRGQGSSQVAAWLVAHL
jgi:hypothetical protein